MADYPSALTGAQMDIALLDVAQHNSEAWAVGTRSGNAVSFGDATYNNNAKYYAESAYESAARASGSIPSGTAGAVFFDRAQSLTDAQKAQARANISAANSNRNLLDNPFFTNVVNQRGSASYSANAEAYWIDRWIANGSFSVSSSGLSCSSSSWYITQYFEEYRIISGEVYTLSALFSDGTIWSATGTVTTSSGATSWQLLYGTQNTSGIALRHYSAARPWQVALWINTSKTVIAIKLEKGSYSTIINDVPPDYEKELRHCQFYYRRIANPLGSPIWALTGGINVLTTAADFALNEPMYPNTGTIAKNGTMSVNGNIVTNVTLYSRSNGKYTQNTIRFAVASGLTQYGAAAIAMDSGAYVEISHDL